MKRLLGLLLILGLSSADIHSQTIAEKRAGLEGGYSDLDQELLAFVREVNVEIREWQDELRILYQEVRELYQQDASAEEYQALLSEINQIRDNIRALEESFREVAIKKGKKEEEYGLFHQPDTTIEQLIMEYGSQDYVFLMTPAISAIELSINSNIPIPRSAWQGMLEQILVQNGVGIRELNPFLKELYLVNEDQSGIKLITNNPEDLEVYPPETRVSFVLTPEPSDIRRSWFFLEKFANAKSVSLQLIGRDILIVGQISSVKELLKIYNFVSDNRGEREYKAIALRKIDPEEMSNILMAVFTGYTEELGGEEGGETPNKKTAQVPTGNSLRVVPLKDVARAIFLIGTPQEIEEAEQIVKEVEGQVGGALQKEIYRYHAMHADPIELADIMYRIYLMMVSTQLQLEAEVVARQQQDLDQRIEGALSRAIEENQDRQRDITRLFRENFYQEGGYIINPAPIEPGGLQPVQYSNNRDNFIVDPKTNSIIMVVESDILPKLKNLMKKLDVPPKMVQIDVLLFEKQVRKENSIGLNLFRSGSAASNTNNNGLQFNDSIDILGRNTTIQTGVLQFLISRTASGYFAPFDLIFKFLISRDDISINSNPSVLALNQTPALIAIREEISINTGTQFVPIAGTNVQQQSFTRAQYGTTISITPIIHTSDEDDDESDPDYITLQTDINFDTIQPGLNPSRPDVNRRQIKNEVRIPDGQTVILGGLRRKNTNDSVDSIPFLGEIPCFGKIFSNTTLQDDSTDMFIFITPKIIYHPEEDLARIRARELCLRPGDIPEFLCCLTQAQECEKRRAYQGTMTMIFGRSPERCVVTEGEWDGR